MYNWYSSYADLSIPSASVPITKQKHTKPYDSFPNQKSVDSHHNSKSSIVCTNCFSTICKPIQISDPEILVYWTYQEWEDSVRLPVGDTPRPSLTSITRIRILSPLHYVTHVSYRLLTFERGISYILSEVKNQDNNGYHIIMKVDPKYCEFVVKERGQTVLYVQSSRPSVSGLLVSAMLFYQKLVTSLQSHGF